MSNPVRVGIAVTDRKIWTGGYNYLLNLVKVSTDHLGGEIAPIVFFGDDIDQADVDRFDALPGTRIVRAAAFRQSRREESFVRAMLWGLDPGISRIFDDCGVDVVLEAAQFYGWRLRKPAIAWMADFQHRLLPQLFSRRAYWRREIGFRAEIYSDRSVMLSSEDARLHCEKFYPTTRGRTHVVKFAVRSRRRLSFDQIRLVADGYRLPANYFFLPNQFWRHKNHECVIRALGMLKRWNRDVTVAASGNPLDRGDPTHWARLSQLIADHGVEGSFRLLGMIPGDHVQALLQGCTALINPSRSEGWSTTVEEAKSAGTPMILSDLPVHREQAGDAAVYFDPDGWEGLAELLRTYPIADDRARLDAAATAEIASRAAVERYAYDFRQVVEAARRGAADPR